MSIPNMINTCYLWPVQKVLKVVAIAFQTFMCTANYCLSNTW